MPLAPWVIPAVVSLVSMALSYKQSKDAQKNLGRGINSPLEGIGQTTKGNNEYSVPVTSPTLMPLSSGSPLIFNKEFASRFMNPNDTGQGQQPGLTAALSLDRQPVQGTQQAGGTTYLSEYFKTHAQELMPIGNAAAESAKQQGANASGTDVNIGDYLSYLSAIAQIAAALRKPPRERTPLYYGQVGTTNASGSAQVTSPISILLGR